MKPTQTRTPGHTEAKVYFMFQHYTLSDEEEDELKPWSHDNRPQVINQEFSHWRYTSWGAEGPRSINVMGYVLRFSDGSAYRIAENWEIGEVLPPDNANQP